MYPFKGKGRGTAQYAAPWVQQSVGGYTDMKRPPAWAPEMESTYPFRFWTKDIVLWAAATDIEDARQGPMVAS